MLDPEGEDHGWQVGRRVDGKETILWIPDADVTHLPRKADSVLAAYRDTLMRQFHKEHGKV